MCSLQVAAMSRNMHAAGKEHLYSLPAVCQSQQGFCQRQMASCPVGQQPHKLFTVIETASVKRTQTLCNIELLSGLPLLISFDESCHVMLDLSFGLMQTDWLRTQQRLPCCSAA